MEVFVTEAPSFDLNLIERAKTLCPSEYKKLRILTLGIASVATAALAISAASLALGAIGFVWGSVAVLAASPLILAVAIIAIVKIDEKTQFWTSKVAELTLLKKALEECDLTLKNNPKDLETLVKRAAICCQLFVQGHPQQLQRAGQDLYAVSKENENFFNEHTHAKLVQGEYLRLESLAIKAQSWHGLRKKKTREALNKNQGALDIFTEVLEKDPKNYFALLTRGEVNRAMGKNEDALADFQHVLTLNPGNSYATSRIARLVSTSKLKNYGRSLSEWVGQQTIPYRVHLI